MKEYRDETYGERIAQVYDAWYEEVDAGTVELLAELANGGPALELGIGTGRVALPLRAQGLEVHGVDASQAMVARLRDKAGGADIPVYLGSFADVPAEGPYALIYVLFNTFFALLTQDEQVSCFQNVAQRLGPGGLFLIEAFVPDLTRFDKGQTVRTTKVDVDAVHLETTQWDPLTQQVTSQHVLLGEDTVRLYPVKLRFAWPAELDLMARLAGLELYQRWENWHRAPFTAKSEKHISVYRRATS